MNAPLFALAQPKPAPAQAAQAQHQAQLALRSQVKQGHWNSVLEHGGVLDADHPNTPFVLSCLGAAHFALSDLDKAHDIFERVIVLDPDDMLARVNLASILVAQTAFDRACIVAQEATQRAPRLPAAYKVLAEALNGAGDMTAALQAVQTCLSLNSNQPNIHSMAGDIHRVSGRLQAAELSYAHALAQSAFYAPAHYGLSIVHKYTPSDPHLAAMVQLYQSDLSPLDRRHIAFALAKAFDEIEHYEAAFAMLADANALRKAELNYDPKKNVMKFQALETSNARLSQLRDITRPQPAKTVPIFVVGMPRSGTSVTERILASHSQITGAGELTYASKFGSKMIFGHETITRSKVKAFRKHYLKALEKHSEGAPYVVDKMPQNFNLLGLIIKAIPEAKIIHVQRDPAATCWSNYKQFFSNPGLKYCYDLADTVDYYRQYAALMARFEVDFPGRILSLDYDAMVSGPEQHIRAMLEGIGLEMQSACLRHHQTDGVTATASSVQVRRALYAGSSQKWQSYAPYIDGAFDVFHTKL